MKVLSDNKIEEATVNAIIGFIELCEMVRYAPATINTPMSDSLSKAEQIIEKIEKS